MHGGRFEPDHTSAGAWPAAAEATDRARAHLYNVDESAAAELMKLTREAREQGWWTQYEDLNLSPYQPLLEFNEPVLPPVVFVEGLVGSPYCERPVDVARYRESIENIRDSALSPRESEQRLLEMQKTYAVGATRVVLDTLFSPWTYHGCTTTQNHVI
jgi:hypothetical protein